MKKIVLFLVLAALLSAALPVVPATAAGTDADKLRVFLAQTKEGKSNADRLGWDIADISTWKGAEWEGDSLTQLELSAAKYDCFGTLDLSGCTALTELKCAVNDLTAIDVSGCTALETLRCAYNEDMASVKVAGCSKLKTLSCHSGVLTALDLTGCADLTYLNCENNQLTALDLTKCHKLRDVDCSNNKITALDLSTCTEVRYVLAHKNPLTDTAAFLAGLNENMYNYSYTKDEATFYTDIRNGKTITVKSLGAGYAYAQLKYSEMDLTLYTRKDNFDIDFLRWEDAVGITAPIGDGLSSFSATMTADTASITAVFQDAIVAPKGVPGDANGDTNVNIDDILLVRDVIFGLKTLTEQGLANCNYTSNAQVNINTILFIRDIIFQG